MIILVFKKRHRQPWWSPILLVNNIIFSYLKLLNHLKTYFIRCFKFPRVQKIFTYDKVFNSKLSNRKSLLNNKSLLLPYMALFPKHYEIHKHLVCPNRPKLQCFRSKDHSLNRKRVAIILKKK